MQSTATQDLLLHPHDHKKKSDWDAIFALLDEHIDYSKIKRVLDRGSGLGDLGFHFIKNNKRCEVICEDNNNEYLDIASKRHPNIKKFLHDINEKLPFEDNSFDLVSCIGTLYHYFIRNPKEILKEMIRVSNHYIFVDFLFKNNPWALLHKLIYPSFKPKRYTKLEVKQIIDDYQLKVIAQRGTRILFPQLLSSWGRITLFLLEKTNVTK